jgi:hypothetical protein
MLSDYIDEKHRAEYNSIKHGLRASHGRFELAVGIEEVPGVQASNEAMQLIGSSRDSSLFEIAKPLTNATKQQSKINFLTYQISVAWSMEKVLIELQLLSLLICNVVSELRIAAGVSPISVKFTKIADDEKFWELYFGLSSSNIRNSSFGIVIDALEVPIMTEKQVFDSYKLE